MINRISRLWKLPLSRKLQYISFRWATLVGFLFYRPRLRACGLKNLVLRPLFWTPEYITLGNNVLIWPGCRIEGLETVESVPHIVIGDGVTMQQNCHITAAGILRIESGTTILYGVMITDIDHRYDQFGMRVADQPIEIKETRIGPNCFIGSGAKIFPGTVLGEHCVIGANAVVRGNYPAGSVIVGVPGKIVKQYDNASKNWRRV